MSVDINWEALAGGHDGLALSEEIRAFIHERFQQIELPKFIRSVKVHSFDFGTIAPVLELKDVCDPLPDFYEDDDEEDDDIDGEMSTGPSTYPVRDTPQPTHRGFGPVYKPNAAIEHDRSQTQRQRPHRPSVDTNFSNAPYLIPLLGNSHTFLSRASTPGIPGGTSNMGYFHLPLSAGISGTATPLATAVGAQFGAGWPEHFHHSHVAPADNEPASDSRTRSFASDGSRSGPNHDSIDSSSPPPRAIREKSADDLQIVMHLKYSGNVKLSLTAEILLDYPMPSFVGIPLKLNVTGLTFDGVAILAYIKNKAHFCFLAPEDAEALVGRDSNHEPEQRSNMSTRRHQEARLGGLFEEIKVETEIGQKMNGKQVLKNVGKVEKFVLEQVRSLFEGEFVYPSFWTFLV